MYYRILHFNEPLLVAKDLRVARRIALNHVFAHGKVAYVDQYDENDEPTGQRLRVALGRITHN